MRKNDGWSGFCCFCDSGHGCNNRLLAGFEMGLFHEMRIVSNRNGNSFIDIYAMSYPWESGLEYIERVNESGPVLGPPD